jgi:hypothetical protein
MLSYWDNPEYVEALRRSFLPPVPSKFTYNYQRDGLKIGIPRSVRGYGTDSIGRMKSNKDTGRKEPTL